MAWQERVQDRILLDGMEALKISPAGTSENSPPIYRRVTVPYGSKSRQGRKRTRPRVWFCRPCGTGHALVLDPALKRWASFDLSLRDEERRRIRRRSEEFCLAPGWGLVDSIDNCTPV